MSGPVPLVNQFPPALLSITQQPHPCPSCPSGPHSPVRQSRAGPGSHRVAQDVPPPRGRTRQDHPPPAEPPEHWGQRHGGTSGALQVRGGSFRMRGLGSVPSLGNCHTNGYCRKDMAAPIWTLSYGRSQLENMAAPIRELPLRRGSFRVLGRGSRSPSAATARLRTTRKYGGPHQGTSGAGRAHPDQMARFLIPLSDATVQAGTPVKTWLRRT